MAGDTLVTIVGNLTNDPELRFTPSGAAVANFTVASTPRSFDRNSNEWKDGETCSCAARSGVKRPRTSLSR
jgi:single-strand DNA-binding protein